MKLLYAPLLAVILCVGSASAQLVSVFHESSDNGDGTTTFQIFVSVEDPTDFVSAVYSAGDDDLFLGTTDNIIINDSFGVTTGDALQLGFCGLVPTLCSESFLTIGWANDTNFYDGTPVGCGQGITALSTQPAGTPFDDSFGDANGPNLALYDGSWFTLNANGCNDNGLPIGPDNRVLIAQIKVNTGQDLAYTLNVQIFDEAIGENTLFYVGNAATVNNTDIDGSCLGLQYPPECDGVPGCTDPEACNYDPVATEDDGTCLVCQVETFPEELFLSCDAPVDFFEPIETEWIPDCMNWEFAYSDPGFSCLNDFSVTHIYTLEDPCGNFIEIQQDVNVDDNEPPTITQFPPEDITVPTIEDIPDCSGIEVLGIDNCFGEVTIDWYEYVAGDECTYVHGCQWVLTDICGNVTSTT
jgi:hypothetical protein